MKKIDCFAIGIMSALFVALLALAWQAGETESRDSLMRKAPALSVGSGFYEDTFQLEIDVPARSRVYYTLDGSCPDENSCLYTGPIEIASRGVGEPDVTFVQNIQQDWMNGAGESHPNLATVLRACAIYEDGGISDVVTATYFVGPGHYKDKLAVSLVADPEDLFGENGIYVTGKAYDDWYLGGQIGDAPPMNFWQEGAEWERPAVVELFQGESILQQQAGIRIQGSSARAYGNKRFSIYARKKYGGSWFETSVFGGERVHSFMLRSGFMNGYIQYLVQDRAVAAAKSREVVAYLNGAMWYITIAQEKYSGKFFQEKYGVDDDNVIIVKNGVLADGEEGDMALYEAMYDFLNTHDMCEESSYEELNRLMDIQSYIDFSCVNVYFANLDYNEEKNILCWRARKTGPGEYEDGRWRWALYDMDLENLDYGVRMEDVNTFTTDTHYAGGAFNTRPMYTALKKNPRFCRQFVLSFMDMVNTDFTVPRAEKAMEDWGATPEWWGMSRDWVSSFFPARTKSVIGHVAEEFGLEGSCENLTLSANEGSAGRIRLNTLELDLTEEWSGSYFTDYPVTVTASANEGYEFAGWKSDAWEGVREERELTLEIPVGGLSLTAVFQSAGDK